MENNYQKLLEDFQNDLNQINNPTKMVEAKNIFIKKYLLPLYDELRNAVVKDKKALGLMINDFKNQINEIFDQCHQKILNEAINANNVINYRFDVDTANFVKGAYSPLSIITNQITGFFQRMSFSFYTDSELVDTKYNFDHLNIDINHPARAQHDSLYVNAQKMLRTHATAVSAKKLENNDHQDIRIVSFGSVYRHDDDDLTHSHQFNQLDLIWVKKGFNVKNLKWLVNELLKFIFGKKIKVRYRLSYFPFTEPSFEVDATCRKCSGKGCSMCKQTGWIEILGAGMLHQNVFQAAKIDLHMTGLAFGIGIDRLAMLKFGIKDIRDLYTNNFRFINQFKGK